MDHNLHDVPTFACLNKPQKRALILRDQLRYLEPHHLDTFLHGLSVPEPPPYRLVPGSTTVDPPFKPVTLTTTATRFDLGNVQFPAEAGSVSHAFLVLEDGIFEIKTTAALERDDAVLATTPIHAFIAGNMLPLFKSKIHAIKERCESVNAARRAAWEAAGRKAIHLEAEKNGETLSSIVAPPLHQQQPPSISVINSIARHCSNKRRRLALAAIPSRTKTATFDAVPAVLKSSLFDAVVQTALPGFDDLLTASWNVVSVYSNVGSDFPELHRAVCELKGALERWEGCVRGEEAVPESKLMARPGLASSPSPLPIRDPSQTAAPVRISSVQMAAPMRASSVQVATPSTQVTDVSTPSIRRPAEKKSTEASAGKEERDDDYRTILDLTDLDRRMEEEANQLLISHLERIANTPKPIVADPQYQHQQRPAPSPSLPHPPIPRQSAYTSSIVRTNIHSANAAASRPIVVTHTNNGGGSGKGSGNDVLSSAGSPQGLKRAMSMSPATGMSPHVQAGGHPSAHASARNHPHPQPQPQQHISKHMQRQYHSTAPKQQQAQDNGSSSSQQYSQAKSQNQNYTHPDPPTLGSTPASTPRDRTPSTRGEARFRPAGNPNATATLTATPSMGGVKVPASTVSVTQLQRQRQTQTQQKMQGHIQNKTAAPNVYTAGPAGASVGSSALAPPPLPRRIPSPGHAHAHGLINVSPAILAPGTPPSVVGSGEPAAAQYETQAHTQTSGGASAGAVPTLLPASSPSPSPSPTASSPSAMPSSPSSKPSQTQGPAPAHQGLGLGLGRGLELGVNVGGAFPHAHAHAHTPRAQVRGPVLSTSNTTKDSGGEELHTHVHANANAKPTPTLTPMTIPQPHPPPPPTFLGDSLLGPPRKVCGIAPVASMVPQAQARAQSVSIGQGRSDDGEYEREREREREAR